MLKLELPDTVPAGKTAMLMVLTMLDNDEPVLDGEWPISELAPDSPLSAALSINSSGQIVGFVLTDQGEYHAALWQPKAGGGYEMTDLSTIIPGWFFDQAFSINDAGVIAVEGFRTDDPSMTFLPGLLFPNEQ